MAPSPENEVPEPAAHLGRGFPGATALTSGACALLTQWWRREAGRDPSPALLRALVVNGAVDTGDGGPIPNRRQGWGRLNLENILAPDLRRAWLDQSLLFTASGQQRVWPIRLADAARPFKITLAWTDPPGPLGSGTPEISAIVNRLALRVEVGEKTYFGNRFAERLVDPGRCRAGRMGQSPECLSARGSRSRGDPAQVSVTALEVAMDCLTGHVEPPRQDFALWISNGVLESEAKSRGAAIAPLPGG